MAKQMLSLEELKELIGTVVTERVGALGLTKVDHKHAIFPDMDDMTGRRPLSPEKAAAVACFFRGLFLPEARYQETGGLGGPYWKDMSVTADSAGGFLVPTEFRAQVIMAMEKLPVMRNLVSVFPIQAKDEIPRVTAKPSASWGSENTTFNAGSDDPTLDNVTLSTNLLKILTKLSRKLVANARVDVVQLMTQLFAQAFSKAEDAAFMGGNGSGKPTGLRYAGQGVASVGQAGGSITGDDLISLYHALGSQYRPTAYWLMNDAVIAKIRKLKEAVTGQYLWVPGLAGAPATILGRPVLEQNDIPTNLGGASPAVESEIWFGDPKFYYVGDGESMSIEATTVGGDAFASHQLFIKAWEEVDGKIALAEAFKVMTGVK